VRARSSSLSDGPKSRRRCPDGGVDLVGVELGVDEEQARVERRVRRRRDPAHQLLAVLDLAVEPRAVAAAEHHGEQVEVGRVGIAEGGAAPGDAQLRLLEVAGHDRGARRALRRLGRARVLEAGPRLRARERLLDLRQHVGALEVADRDEGHVVGHVPVVVEVEQPLAAEAAYTFLCPDDFAPVGVPGVGGLEQRLRDHAVGRVVGAPDLLDHDLLFLGELPRVEGRVQHRVGQHVDTHGGVLARHGDVVDGHIVRGEGVDVAAGALDGGGDLAHAAALGALEQHVLVHVRHAPLLGLLVRTAGADPDVERHHGRGVVLDQDHGETVVERGSQHAFLLLARSGAVPAGNHRARTQYGCQGQAGDPPSQRSSSAAEVGGIG